MSVDNIQNTYDNLGKSIERLTRYRNQIDQVKRNRDRWVKGQAADELDIQLISVLKRLDSNISSMQFLRKKLRNVKLDMVAKNKK